jgi:hypothetical protein
MLEDDDYTLEAYEKKPLTAEANLANMGTLQKGTVKRRKRDEDGNPVGRRHDNPLLDTSEYEVEFLDGASGMELVPTLLWQPALPKVCTRKSTKMARNRIRS